MASSRGQVATIEKHDRMGHSSPEREVTSLRDLSPQQWKSGIAAWLGWLFDGLDMHLYVLVATPFVAELLGATKSEGPGRWLLRLADPSCISDRLGAGWRLLWPHRRSHRPQPGADADDPHLCRVHGPLVLRANLVAVVYLSLSGGARHWRRMGSGGLAPVGNVAQALAAVDRGGFANRRQHRRHVREPGRLSYWPTSRREPCSSSAFCRRSWCLWIRRAVPEPEEWRGAKQRAGAAAPRFRDLFRGKVRRTTILTLLVCGFSLTAHWAFLFWYQRQLRNHPDLNGWS